ncbi:MAG: hypothetical protein M1839_001800 [Geoglossum umbratile]|nr:MAG: hypothetical protein M1839_001800 [Geoglossum umbratile]
MADTMGRTSFLPTVKCSSCGAEIEISMMGDHLCSSAPQRKNAVATRLADHSFRFKDTPPPSTRVNGSGNDSLKPGRTAPPRIDPQVANRPFMRQEQLTPISNYSDSHDVSPITPFPNPFRGLASTPPRSLRALTPEIESDPPDERRALFPASRSATSTLPRSLGPPTPELESKLNSSPPRVPRTASTEPGRAGERSRTDQLYVEPSPLYAPLSPRTTGGGNVVQRMNTLAPGPFGIRSAQTPSSDRPEDTAQSKGHQRNRSSKGSSGPHSAVTRSALPPSRDGPVPYAQRPSTAGSEKSQRRTGFDGSEFRNKNFLDQLAASPWSDKQEEVRGGQGEFKPPEMGTDSLRPESRSRTLPIEIRSKPLPRRPTDQSQDTFERRPSTSGSLGRNQYGDNSFVPWGGEQPQTRGREDAAYHKQTLSRSSNGSGSGSDTRTASSRSTPPASGTYRKSRRRPSDTSNIDGLLNEIQASMRLQQSTDAMAKETKTSTSAQRPTDVVTKGLENPRTPRFPGPLGTPISPRDPRLGGRDIASKPPRPPMSPIDPPSRGTDNKSPYRRPTTAKGNCRGCGEPIKGKSVSSADGRLTGRYHKQCFVCKTCKEPFETATFYILQNNPFCERHYHQLNNSLCYACDQGIEGQYLETERNQKYHKYCFKCHECQMVLRDDYYEHNKQAYCERHALRLVQQSSGLGPGRRNPERRTTKLMTMI